VSAARDAGRNRRRVGKSICFGPAAENPSRCDKGDASAWPDDHKGLSGKHLRNVRIIFRRLSVQRRRPKNAKFCRGRAASGVLLRIYIAKDRGNPEVLITVVQELYGRHEKKCEYSPGTRDRGPVLRCVTGMWCPWLCPGRLRSQDSKGRSGASRCAKDLALQTIEPVGRVCGEPIVREYLELGGGKPKV